MDVASKPFGDSSSDYGSDFSPEEEDALIALLSQVSHKVEVAPVFKVEDIEDNERPHGAHMPRKLGLYSKTAASQTGKKTTTTVEYAGREESIQNIESDESRAVRQSSVPTESGTTPAPAAPDLRSPLERFRAKPKKALSVTDLVSPSWCELQYWYVLTKHGRKRRTPAMRQGSAVHKTLEDQVHETVSVDIETKEDAWGLRIWNIIQGLKTLRTTGMTREFEVWGIVDGLVVNGVIDELSYICPDKDLEEEVTARTAHRKADKNEASVDQSKITSFLTSPSGQRGVLRSLRSMRKKTDKIYLTDVKTRGVKSVPKGASFRPTLMQLMLYHLMLSDLATNQIDANVLFNRYDLNQTANFSDSFVAQLGSLNEAFYDAPTEPSHSQELSDSISGEDQMKLLLDHNSLRSLWNLMIQEFQNTMPAGVDSIGNVLKAEYRNQTDGSIQGIKTFLYDRSVIQNYIDDEMRWWKGERKAQGVSVEEAYKCRSCEFAEECDWRREKIEEATNAQRARSRSVV